MKKLVAFWFFIFCLLTCCAQKANYRFDNLTEKQGLADANIASITKDHTGYMWFASSEGLTRFDGRNCKVYHHLNADENSLSSDNINAIFEDHKHRLWIATRNGLNLYDPVNDNFRRFFNDTANKNSISSNEIWSLAEDNYGRLWIGTMGGGLNRLIETKNKENAAIDLSFIHFKHDSTSSTSLSDDIVWSIAFDKLGRGWIGTNNGLNRFTLKDADDSEIKFSRYYNDGSKNSITNNIIWRVKAAGNNSIWLLSFTGMLDCMIADDGEVKFIHVLPVIANALQIKDLNALSMIDDGANGFWVGTDKHGLVHCRLNIEAGTQMAGVHFIEDFRHEHDDNRSLVDDAVYDLYKDESGLIWIGTANGVSRYTPQKKLFDQLGLRVINFPVKLIHADKEFTWFASNNQLWFLKNGGTTIRLVCNMDRSAEITCLHRTNSGNLLIGTSNNGIFFIPGNNIRGAPEDKLLQPAPLNLSSGYSAGSIFSFLSEGTADILTGSYSMIGLLNPDSRSFAPFTTPQQAGVTSIFRCLASAGDHYFAGTDNGLYTITKNDHKVSAWQPREGKLSSDRINALLVTKNELWIATMNGLNVLDLHTGAVKNYFTEDGLADNNITSLCSDGENNIWIATRNGLSYYNAKTKIFSVFSENEGLNSNQLNSLAFTRNILFIGGDDGINTLSPSALKNPNPKINIAVTDFKIAGRSQFTYPLTNAGKAVKLAQPVHVSWRENNISIEFTALEYKNPGGVKYAYMLAGFDKNWVYTGNGSQVNYTNLQGGDYTFKVKYAGNDGLWHESNIAIQVHVSTAWFKAWWFYLACSVVVLGLFYSFYRIRLKRVLEMQQVRNKIARDLHDDIGSTLSSIKILSEAAAKKIHNESSDAEQMIKKIGDSSRKMMDSMSDIVWSINPDNDTVDNVVVRMREYAAQALEPANIVYHVDAGDKLMDIKLPLEKRRDFFLVFKEAINNLAKYSCASKAEISIMSGSNLLELAVKDNGKGFDAASQHRGNGLKNMKKRAADMKGRLEITSDEKGTVILLSIPLT